MEKPPEDIRILKALVRDLQENIHHIEKELNERLNRMQNKIGELIQQNEKPETNTESKAISESV